MHFPILQDILIILGFSVVVVVILLRFKLPSILGFLVTGIIIGPHGLSLVTAIEQVEVIAEIGVILLLFVIGMELSIKQLIAIRRTVFIGGLLQVTLTILVTALIFNFVGLSLEQAVFIGFLFSLSSTAIVLKVLQDRNEIASPHGRNALGILIFQDIIVVPMMLVTPIMAGHATDVWWAVGELLIKSLLVVVVTYVSARYIMPRFMYLIAQTRSKELFLLTTMAVCFAVAYLTSHAGLSLALGAFIAGLIISESEYSHQATSTILPFRELFTSFFFISIGMLLDLSFFLDHVVVILLIAAGVFIIKGMLISITTALLGYSVRTNLLTGMALFQVGEFAFILSKVGIEYGLMSDETNQYFLAVSIVTMLVTPFVLIYAGNISETLLKSKLTRRLQFRKTIDITSDLKEGLSMLTNHLIIIGYGINGRNLAKAARHASIPYLIVELNPETVRAEMAKGEPIIFGDPVHDHILHEIGLNQARVVVIAISDPKATKAIISNIRSQSQSVYLIVRTRYVKEMDEILALGADEVIPEEFETSVEIFSRVLVNYLVPLDELKNVVESIRASNYEMLLPKGKKARSASVNLSDLKIVCLRVIADSGAIVGKTLLQTDVRKKFGVTILAISRKEQMIHSILPEEKILQHDLLYITGDQAHIDEFNKQIGAEA